MLLSSTEDSTSSTNNRKIDRKPQSLDLTQDEMLGVFAHELRNPLAAIRNELEVLRRCDDDVVTREGTLGVLERQAQHMAFLLDGLLDLSRFCHGKVQRENESVDLAQVVDTAVETVRPQIDERGQLLEITLPSISVIVTADPTWIQHMLINLLMNASKYTDVGGRIWLTGLPEGDDIVLRVRDNGIGIASELLPQVFDFFWQASPAGGRPGCGLGIGLALVHKIVEMHGGYVTAFSAGLGQGGEFAVFLPRMTSPTTHNGTPRAEEA